jgi:hypothetical protein
MPGWNRPFNAKWKRGWEGAMIEWIKRGDGSWTFDYRIFDQYVSLAMECGIDRSSTIPL